MSRKSEDREHPDQPLGVSRRRLLRSSAAAAAGATFAFSPRTAGAAVPAAGKQFPAVQRWKIGSVEVTAFCDGFLNLAPTTVQGSGLDALTAFGPVPTSVNVFTVNTGGRLYLVDAGMGSARGSDLGHLVPALRAGGIAPEDIDAVLITHLHVDHTGGLVVADGRATFPRAELIVPETDAEFWLDPGLPSRAREVMKPSIQYAIAAEKAYGGRFTRFRAGASPAPGIESVSLPGHSPGHTGYMVGAGSERMLIWGDIIHFAPFQFGRPDWTVVFDYDPALATATRRRAFDMAVTDRLLVAGMHHPFPGLGRLGRKGDEFMFVQEPWRPNLS